MAYSYRAAANVPPLSGTSLLAAVRAAEVPITGELVKALFFKQLGIEDALRIDLDATCGDDAPHAAVMAVVTPAHSHTAPEEG